MPLDQQPLLSTEPFGMVVLQRIAPFNFAPLRFEPFNVAPVKLALNSTELSRLASVRFTPLRLVLNRLAYISSAPLRSASLKSHRTHELVVFSAFKSLGSNADALLAYRIIEAVSADCKCFIFYSFVTFAGFTWSAILRLILAIIIAV